MKTKSKYKATADLLDKVFSVYIRHRDKLKWGLCPICNKRPIEVCFHFFPRGNKSLRWEPDNCCGSCRGCNFEERERRNIAMSEEKFKAAHIRLIGEARRNELELMKSVIFKKSAEELLDMKRHFEELLSRGNNV